jgi:hypothetical protein
MVEEEEDEDDGEENGGGRTTQSKGVGAGNHVATNQQRSATGAKATHSVSCRANTSDPQHVRHVNTSTGSKTSTGSLCTISQPAQHHGNQQLLPGNEHGHSAHHAGELRSVFFLSRVARINVLILF